VSVLEVAQKRQDRLIRVNETVTARGLRLWSRMTGDFDVSYAQIEPELERSGVRGAVRGGVGGERGGLGLCAGVPRLRAGLERHRPAGVCGHRRVRARGSTLLHGAVTTTKEAVGAGLGTTRAFESGAAYLAAMIKTALADIGRSSDLTAATGKGFTHYVRVVSPGACSRCAILAGVGSYQTAFKRHPACKCTAAPVPDGEDAPRASSPPRALLRLAGALRTGPGVHEGGR
jgi:hypothetical protein